MNQDESSPWQYKADANEPPKDDDSPDSRQSRSSKSRAPESYSWEAPEFIAHPHGSGWYALLGLITIAFAALVYILAKDKVATGTIAVVGIIVGVFASHKPGQAKYEINDSGLSINDKFYPYSAFKSFSVINEGTLSSVNLLPLKRFMPPVSAYFQPDDEDKIADVLGNYLPFEDRKLDIIERLSRRLHL